MWAGHNSKKVAWHNTERLLCTHYNLHIINIGQSTRKTENWAHFFSTHTVSELKCHSTLPKPNNGRQQQKTLREMEYKAHSHAAIYVDVALRLLSVVPRRSRSTQLIICSFCSHCSTAPHSRVLAGSEESPLSFAKKSTLWQSFCLLIQLDHHVPNSDWKQMKFSTRYFSFFLYVPSWGSRCRVGRAATKQ